MANQTLTRRQYAVFRAIEGFIRENGHGPTFDQIAVSIGINSRATVSAHVHKIEKKGYLRFDGPGSFTILVGLQ